MLFKLFIFVHSRSYEIPTFFSLVYILFLRFYAILDVGISFIDDLIYHLKQLYLICNPKKKIKIYVFSFFNFLINNKDPLTLKKKNIYIYIYIYFNIIYRLSTIILPYYLISIKINLRIFNLLINMGIGSSHNFKKKKKRTIKYLMNKRSNYFYHTIIWIISEKEIIICCNFIILGINKNTMFFYSHQKKIYILK